MAGRASSQIRRFYPKRGSVMETFRAELREVWRVISTAEDPRGRGWAMGLWVPESERGEGVMLTHTRKALGAVRSVLGGRSRRRSSFNALLAMRVGCSPVTGEHHVVLAAFPFMDPRSAESRQWTVRRDAVRFLAFI